MKVSTLFTLAFLTVGPSLAYAGSDANLTAENGMTLYTFDKDTAGASACYGGCADKWPPYIAAEGTEIPGLTTIERQDGSKQWAKDGKPLYFWMGDSKPGDTSGDGLGGVWHIAH
ncbi:COG4315 family predicted lipoprotein [Kiloniella laminariae]|uniref:COG4315 family predicted lipoprotein n=1 Tax=Kiloniella laminariae TaxID=454162 RepID=UPI000375D0CC|nr:hypothetical protein [Kiloniella laminariae]